MAARSERARPTSARGDVAGADRRGTGGEPDEAREARVPPDHDGGAPRPGAARSRHALRVDHAGQRAERLDHPGPRPVDEVAVDPVHAALAHGGDRAEPLPAAEERPRRPLPVAADDDAVRAPLDDRLQREPGVRERLGAGDALAAGPLDELA